jgi:exopolyphosphatase/guanosine-5'-triphosphate,3'-diphosphate pyrophosphatase
MLIGEVVEDPARGNGSLNVNRVADFYEVPRVGKNVSATKKLAADAMERGIEVLGKYRAIARDYGAEKIVASATSAVRDAANRQDFIKMIKDKFDFDAEVISGETEAKLGYLAAVSGAPNRAEPTVAKGFTVRVPTFVIDIGGGSTELCYGIGMEPEKSMSVDVGAVRLTEKFFVHNPPSDIELKNAAEFVEDALNVYPFSEINPTLIFAVAGTATTLALIAQKKYEFDVEAVTNYEMSYDVLKNVFKDIRWKLPAEIRQMTAAAEGRADVLLAGTLILLKVLEAIGATKFLTTDRGLRYGYLLYKHMQFLGR